MLTTLLSVPLQTAAPSANLQTAALVAEIVIAVAMLVLVLAGVALFVKTSRLLTELRRSAHQNFGPVSDRARSISDNLEYISQAVRTDVQGLHDSVQALTGRLNTASERMEERITDFNALMEVVQGEAEQIFLDAASTAAGVREGARAITDRTAAGHDDRGGRDDGFEDDDSEVLDEHEEVVESDYDGA